MSGHNHDAGRHRPGHLYMPIDCARGRDRSEVAAFFERQSRFWNSLTSAAGYRRAYRDLFEKLRDAGLLPVRSHRVLDAGAGTGTLVDAYVSATAAGVDLFAVDLSVGMLKRAGEVLVQRRTSLIAGDVAQLPFGSNFFDIAMSAHCLEHTDDPCATVAELTRVVRPGGLLLFVISRPGPLDSITRTVWRYRNIEACDVLRWMWEHGAAPLGSMMFGSRRQIGHWLSQAVVGRRTGVA